MNFFYVNFWQLKSPLNMFLQQSFNVSVNNFNLKNRHSLCKRHFLSKEFCDLKFVEVFFRNTFWFIDAYGYSKLYVQCSICTHRSLHSYHTKVRIESNRQGRVRVTELQLVRILFHCSCGYVCEFVVYTNFKKILYFLNRSISLIQ